MDKKRGIAILGSTGSIGQQALEVIETHADKFDLQVLTACKNASLLIKQARKFEPNTVVISDESLYETVKKALEDLDIHVYTGNDALCQVVESNQVDVVLSALVGYAGLKPTLHAIWAKKTIALANKETLVAAGQLVTSEAQRCGVNIYPVDSEHSAIFQCLVGEFQNKIEKVYLTASGGPFRGFTNDKLKRVTKNEALKHPNWSMGAKITIDSASMMNKGLEVIEAKWLFNLKPNQIDVVVHPQSVVHSLVQFEDGSLKAQIGLPDMKLPIQFALSYPTRWKTNYPRFNFMDYPNLSFEKADKLTFKNLELAYQSMELGGTAACSLNAANEIAVQAFLDDKIKFVQIAELNEKTMHRTRNIENPKLSDYITIDSESRIIANELILEL